MSNNSEMKARRADVIITANACAAAASEMELKNGSTTEQEIDQSAERSTTILAGIPPEDFAPGSLSPVSSGQTSARSMPWVRVLPRPAGRRLIDINAPQ